MPLCRVRPPCAHPNMSPFDLVVSKLEGFRRSGRGRGMARCPAHKDRRASLSVRETDSGSVLLHCFASCEVEAVVSSLGLRMEDLFPARGEPGQGRRSERQPYSVRDLVDALRFELSVAWVLLADLEAGKEPTGADRRRAGLAKARCQALIEELRLAR